MRPVGIGRQHPAASAPHAGGLFANRGANSLLIRNIRCTTPTTVLGILAALLASVTLAGQGAGALENVIVRCSTSCEVLAGSIRAFGGQVTFRYENVAALAATVPADRLPDLLEIAGERSVWKDRLVPVPEALDASNGAGQGGGSTVSLDQLEGTSLNGEQVTELAASTYQLDNFTYNNNLTGAAALHATGVQGEGTIVAVIDSGTANAPAVTALSGSVVGGESLLDDLGPGKSATSTLNDPHGTRVATMIAAHARFQFANTSSLVRSLRIHSPESVIPCQASLLSSPCPANSSLIPMIGTAPAAKIYALKVVSSLGGGAPESRLVAAMDRVLTLRRNFNAGMPSTPVRGDGTENNPFVFDSLKIQVVNMSIGGPTLFAGQGLADDLTVKMLRAGIVVVASAGNNGPAAMTGGSPGTGRGALTVGAASSYIHERVLRDLQFGVGSGVLHRPLAQHQTWSMSSRGPTADGRWSPDMIANGFGSFMQDAKGGVALSTGTSFAAPTVAGAAALLAGDAPWASAAQIRNALISTANAAVLGDGSGRIDQGRGFVDIPAAQQMLRSDRVSSRLARGLASERVRMNVKALGIDMVKFTENHFSTRIQSLKPGQVAHFFVPTPRDLADITIKLTDVVVDDPIKFPPNILFGDTVNVHVVDAPTSKAQLHVDNVFVSADTTFVVPRPQPGLMRIAVAGSFSNGGTVSVSLEIVRREEPRGRPTEHGQVRQGERVPVQVEVPAGTKELSFDLSWDSHWGRYPTADIDLLLADPLGTMNSTDGATLESPERVTIANPIPGVWTAYVSAITIHSELGDEDDDRHRDWRRHDHEKCAEEFTLRVDADGQRLPRVKLPKPPRRKSH